jgi:hypothetical protein
MPSTSTAINIEINKVTGMQKENLKNGGAAMPLASTTAVV